ncbi:hypothetical protein [Achromobacter xylosoxidans]|uniref:hypothetical protein n=1 Tax=Alcaligenes xylosoxydans xylosoxydans TaxID=85698 RepID=UPI00106052C0|nr:hypothetical protein [Achromobacter xylosoxidans]
MLDGANRSDALTFGLLQFVALGLVTGGPKTKLLEDGRDEWPVRKFPCHVIRDALCQSQLMTKPQLGVRLSQFFVDSRPISLQSVHFHVSLLDWAAPSYSPCPRADMRKALDFRVRLHRSFVRVQMVGAV